jgi:dihydrofolate reductase
MDQQMGMPFELLLGRKTYDIFASYWPEHENDPPGAVFNKTTKYVVSDTLTDLGWRNSVLIDGDIVAKLQKLKDSDGPMLQVHGSGDLFQTLMSNDLVDELWLKIFPVTLGSGKHLFAEGTVPRAFELTESRAVSSGVIFANYKRSGDVMTGTVA